MFQNLGMLSLWDHVACDRGERGGGGGGATGFLFSSTSCEVSTGTD